MWACCRPKVHTTVARRRQRGFVFPNIWLYTLIYSLFKLQTTEMISSIMTFTDACELCPVLSREKLATRSWPQRILRKRCSATDTSSKIHEGHLLALLMQKQQWKLRGETTWDSDGTSSPWFGCICLMYKLIVPIRSRKGYRAYQCTVFATTAV